ncbi:hypothetical protein AAG906_032881 [Vitis piasezkii]
MYDSDCDGDRDDDEFIDEQRAGFLSNLVVEHERLIKSYMKNNVILKAHKNKIDVFNVKKTNSLEKIRFLESKHHSFLEKNNALAQEIKNNKPSSFSNENFHPRTKMLNEILDKCKTHDKSSFTSLENYNGGTVTFRDGSLTYVKGKDSLVIHGCPKLDEVLYIERLKANLLSINQMCDKDHKVNFHQDLCEVVNKECKIVIT